MKKLHHYFLLAIGIIILDQLTKYGTFINRFDLPINVIGSWFKINYVLNSGMAFGAEFGGIYGKLFLSIFRVIAVIFIGLYLKKIYATKAKKGLLITISMIFAGAIGNTIDSMIYGVLNPENLMVKNAPFSFFYGKVIDMFHLDLIIVHVPKWFPIFSDTYYPLWPVFNIADASIFIAVSVILLFQKKFFDQKA